MQQGSAKETGHTTAHGGDAVGGPGTDRTARLIALLGRTLALAPEVVDAMTRDTALFGNLPELDSMAVATVLTAIEDEFGILIDDDDISGEMFENVGALAGFIADRS